MDAVIRGTDSRCKVIGLADDRAAYVFDDFAKLREIRRCVVTGYRFRLVGCAACVAKPTPGDHRHIATTRRDDRRQHKTNLVANTASRMFVHNRTVQLEILPLEHRS
jgi:hypothetical protein